MIFEFVSNIVSSVCLIQLNKYIFTNYDYPNLTLTCLHLIFTLFCLIICQRFGAFKVKRVSFLQMVPVSVCFCISILFSNYSLKLNTIVAYQCLKSISTPIILIALLKKKENFTFKTHLPIVCADKKFFVLKLDFII